MHEVTVPLADPHVLTRVLPAERIDSLLVDGERLRTALAGAAVISINSTAAGGGVAEMLTADTAITWSAYSVNASAGSSFVWVMVTVANMPSGPSMRRPTSPELGFTVQPSGTATVIVGAAGSDTCATADTAGLTGCEQLTVSAGTGVREVVTMPGAAGPASSVERVGCGLALVDVATLSLRIATPSSVRTHPEAKGATTLSRTTAVQPNCFTTPSSVF